MFPKHGLDGSHSTIITEYDNHDNLYQVLKISITSNILKANRANFSRSLFFLQNHEMKILPTILNLSFIFKASRPNPKKQKKS